MVLCVACVACVACMMRVVCVEYEDVLLRRAAMRAQDAAQGDAQAHAFKDVSTNICCMFLVTS